MFTVGIAGKASIVHPVTPSIGVVVLNWNGWRDTVECLGSLAAADPGPARVLVVDNGSVDESAAKIGQWIDGERRRETARDGVAFEQLVSPTNLGFAGGNNLGLKHVERDATLTHFLLLNNDATVAPDYFAQLDSALQAIPNAGLLSGTVYYAAGRGRAWYAGGRMVPWRGTVSHGTRVPVSPEPRPTGFVSGCAMVISRPALNRLGPLPACYHPMYWEDAEYSLRAQRAGLAVVYAPGVVAHHRITASATTLPRRVEYLYAWHRNRGYFVRRNLTGWARGAAVAYLVVGKAVHAAWRALTGKPRDGWAMLSGTARGLLAPLP